MAASTSDSSTWYGIVMLGLGRPVRLSGWGSIGCLPAKILKFSKLGVAGGLLSQRMRTAALILPSSNMEVTAARRTSERLPGAPCPVPAATVDPGLPHVSSLHLPNCVFGQLFWVELKHPGQI